MHTQGPLMGRTERPTESHTERQTETSLIQNVVSWEDRGNLSVGETKFPFAFACGFPLPETKSVGLQSLRYITQTPPEFALYNANSARVCVI